MGFFTKITYCVSNNETMATISQLQACHFSGIVPEITGISI